MASSVFRSLAVVNETENSSSDSLQVCKAGIVIYDLWIRAVFLV